jgi:hypothetical protein
MGFTAFEFKAIASDLALLQRELCDNRCGMCDYVLCWVKLLITQFYNSFTFLLYLFLICYLLGIFLEITIFNSYSINLIVNYYDLLFE